MPGSERLDLVREAKAARPELRVIVLTMHDGPEYVARAVRGGADAYLLKDSAVHDLVAALEAVTAGHTYFSPPIQQQLAGLLRAGTPAPAGPALTEREREVLALAGPRAVEPPGRRGARHQRAHRRDASRQPDAEARGEVGGAADSGGDPRGHPRTALTSVACTEALP